MLSLYKIDRQAIGGDLSDDPSFVDECIYMALAESGSLNDMSLEIANASIATISRAIGQARQLTRVAYVRQCSGPLYLSRYLLASCENGPYQWAIVQSGPDKARR
jgi:hypothetical protein